MTLSRRAFMRTVGSGPHTPPPHWITARGREALVGEYGPLTSAIVPPPEADEVRISSNENPMGPGPSAIAAIRDHYNDTNRYPMNAAITDTAVRERIASRYGASIDNIVISPGSSEILRNAVRAFTSPERPLVTAECSFENPVEDAELFGTPVKKVPNAPDLGLDLEKMAGAALGAGLVFLCNPNNPTGTVHAKSDIEDFVRFVSKESPYTYILVDEAYHDYVTDPSYETSADLALRHRNVFIGRTFSKAYGMAGLRLGYALGGKEAMAMMRRYKLTLATNVLGLAAAAGSLDDPGYIEREVKRNTEARQFTLDFFTKQGYSATNSQTNFIFVETRMPAKDFREACAKFNVHVGRDFPPYEKTHARISIGTLEEMKQATEIFAQVLEASSTDSGAGPAQGPGRN